MQEFHLGITSETDSIPCLMHANCLANITVICSLSFVNTNDQSHRRLSSYSPNSVYSYGEAGYARGAFCSLG